jgi:hypothetical protein
VGRRDAREIADDVLFPAADEVDRADRVPAAHFDLLAAGGFYGLSGFDELAPAVQAFAGGCLATAFVWTQHRGPLGGGRRHRLVRGAGAGRMPRRDRPGRSADATTLAGTTYRWRLRARRVGPVRHRVGAGRPPDGAARDADDLVHFLFVDADPGPTVAVRRLDLVAANASRTVTLEFDGHRVPVSRLMSTEPLGEWTAADASGSALNGFLALGVAARCCRLLGPGTLDADVAAARAALTAAGRSGTGIAAARAMSSDVAWRAAGALTARTGSRAVLAGHPAQRLAREATLMLAFGTRPSIRDSLVARLGG